MRINSIENLNFEQLKHDDKLCIQQMDMKKKEERIMQINVLKKSVSSSVYLIIKFYRKLLCIMYFYVFLSLQYKAINVENKKKNILVSYDFPTFFMMAE